MFYRSIVMNGVLLYEYMAALQGAGVMAKICKEKINSKWLLTAASVLALAIVETIDYVTGNNVNVSLFYLIPFALITWQVGRVAGIVMVVFCTFTWYLVDVLANELHIHFFIHFWNAAIEGSFFIVFILMLSRLKVAFEREKNLARYDYLTGAANLTAFVERARLEIEKCRRSGKPITIAYLDCDNFKSINDLFGHTAGDYVLRTLVNILKDNLRATDVVARVGGDEFVLLLPETGVESAQAFIKRIQYLITEALRDRFKWPFTASIGIATFASPLDSIEAMIERADKLMYEAKKGGRSFVIKYVLREEASDSEKTQKQTEYAATAS